eukprot:scaffold1054_cov366-Prasinococcus_capsulatus_cf.AAC.5
MLGGISGHAGVFASAPDLGRVEDGNAQMLGGISGHAGVFASAPDLVRLLQAYMRDDSGAGVRSHATSTPELAASAAQPSPRGLVGGDDGLLLNGTTIRLMTKEYNHSQSSRALGWNTNDPGNQHIAFARRERAPGLGAPPS